MIIIITCNNPDELLRTAGSEGPPGLCSLHAVKVRMVRGSQRTEAMCAVGEGQRWDRRKGPSPRTTRQQVTGSHQLQLLSAPDSLLQMIPTEKTRREIKAVQLWLEGVGESEPHSLPPTLSQTRTHNSSRLALRVWERVLIYIC